MSSKCPISFRFTPKTLHAFFISLTRVTFYHKCHILSHVPHSLTCATFSHMCHILSHVSHSLTCATFSHMCHILSHVSHSLTCVTFSHTCHILSHVSHSQPISSTLCTPLNLPFLHSSLCTNFLRRSVVEEVQLSFFSYSNRPSFVPV
jgi:hypothetical protein